MLPAPGLHRYILMNSFFEAGCTESFGCDSYQSIAVAAKAHLDQER